jgi:hypothetical protein
LHVLKSAKKNAKKCDAASPRHSRTPAARHSRTPAAKKFAKKFVAACSGRKTAKVTKSAVVTFAAMSAIELACFGKAQKSFLNTAQVTVLAPLFPPAASYRIIATAIELMQRRGIEDAFYFYIQSRPRTLTLQVVDIVAATLSIAAKLEGAFMWKHMGKHNDVPWTAWVTILGCHLENSKQLEWAMMHAFYTSSCETDCSTICTLFGEQFDSEFWSQYSEPRDID